jgi:hypothetical protein
MTEQHQQWRSGRGRWMWPWTSAKISGAQAAYKNVSSFTCYFKVAIEKLSTTDLFKKSDLHKGIKATLFVYYFFWPKWTTHNFHFLLLFFVLLIHLMFPQTVIFPLFIPLSPSPFLSFFFCFSLSNTTGLMEQSHKKWWIKVSLYIYIYSQLTFLQMCQYGQHRKKYPLITTRLADALCAPFWLVQIYIALTQT